MTKRTGHDLVSVNTAQLLAQNSGITGLIEGQGARSLDPPGGGGESPPSLAEKCRQDPRSCASLSHLPTPTPMITTVCAIVDSRPQSENFVQQTCEGFLLGP